MKSALLQHLKFPKSNEKRSKKIESLKDDLRTKQSNIPVLLLEKLEKSVAIKHIFSTFDREYYGSFSLKNRISESQ